MMDSDGKEHGIHDLSNDELDDLVRELSGLNGDSQDPRKHVEGVGDKKG